MELKGITPYEEIDMQTLQKMTTWLAMLAGGAGFAVLAGCTPMMAGQMAEAGYNVAKTTLGGPDLSAQGADERQKRLQAVLNGAEIGEDVKPILDAMGEPPKEKSGNNYGFTCYEYPGVYTTTESAVIVSTGSKVVFYGNSRCIQEMQDVNFRKDGKYFVSTEQ